MKKVVERVQKENEDLKKAPGVTLQTEIHGLREENQNLKVGLCGSDTFDSIMYSV